MKHPKPKKIKIRIPVAPPMKVHSTDRQYNRQQNRSIIQKETQEAVEEVLDDLNKMSSEELLREIDKSADSPTAKAIAELLEFTDKNNKTKKLDKKVRK
jgi:predicted phosphoribosyltransferase